MPDGPAIQIVYSVQPAVSDGSDWWAGNGVAGQDGWIENKSMLVRVSDEGGELKIVSGGP